VGTTILKPGEATTVLLDLPMGMHTGMDGPHLFRITVPVENEDNGRGDLVLHFQADFR
jgi:hypothetical protein